VFSSYLEFRMMDEVHKPSDSECLWSLHNEHNVSAASDPLNLLCIVLCDVVNIYIAHSIE
jgi:hypothetical protein